MFLEIVLFMVMTILIREGGATDLSKNVLREMNGRYITCEFPATLPNPWQEDLKMNVA